MTNVSIVCQAPSPTNRVVKALLRVLSSLQDQVVLLEDDNALSLTITTTHPLLPESSGTTTITKGVSWMGVLSGLCQQIPTSGMWGFQHSHAALIEGWVELAIHTLVPIIESDKKDALFVSAWLDLCLVVERHLFEKDQTYLVGDTPTAADVVTVVWLVQAAETLGETKLTMPQQCYRWCQTLLQHELLQEYGPTNVTLVEGTPSPSTKPTTTTTTTTTTSSSSSSWKDTNPVLQKLVEWGIPHTVYEHPLCKTAEELVTNVPIPETDSHTKNLFFKDKKHGLFLVTVSPQAALDTKTLGKDKLGLTGKVNLRLADAATLDQHLGVQPGCVGPLSILQDTTGTVQVVLDEKLLQAKEIHSHPLRNDASVRLTPAALQTFLTKAGREPILISFDNEKTTSAAPAATTKPPAPKPKKQAKKQLQQPKKQQQQQSSSDKKSTKKGETLLALQWKKQENFAQWYSDVIVLSEMIAYYDISGCYILRPWSYKIWELIQEWFNVKIQELGVENSYFPLFVSKDRLEKEKDHVEGFAPEVAWVTKSGDGDLAKPIAVRPTSETIMYPAFSDWIRSHRDLPLKLNQWSNVVRWEFKYPTPFLRSREFLWQEGHTAHATYDDANTMVQQALDLYRGVYEDLLAVPVIKGYKTEKEKFAGGHQTTTVEAYIPIAGRAIQGATSHNLGQNFGKMFDINFQDETGQTQIAWQTSWGLTTRTIGVMIMVHGDDTGLVLPPRVSPLQAIVVPILSKKLTIDKANPYCEAIVEDLKSQGIRVKYDDRTMYNPGWKYNHWEQKGVPLRIEVGPRDMEQQQARVVVRFNGDKMDMPVEGLGTALVSKLDEIQDAMLTKARTKRNEHLVTVTDWKDFVPNLEKHNLVLTPWCGGEHQDWEEWVKEKSREESLAARGQEEEDTRTSTSVAAKTLCIPFEQPDLPAGTKCIASNMEATCWVLWGRSY